MSKARDLADLGAVTSRLDTVGASDGALSNRNLIINGAMRVAQRGTSTTGVTGSTYNTIDRFRSNISGLGTYTETQSTDAPDGFSNSFKIECTTADSSPAAADYLIIEQRIEAQNLQGLAYGTSSAKKTTLSFWVKSNVTGTYVVGLYAPDNARGNGKTYTINTASTWEYKTLTFEGDATDGINNDNGDGLRFWWLLNHGSNWEGGTQVDGAWEEYELTNYAVDATADVGNDVGDTFQLTGVQFEIGDTATPFEHRSYADELTRCQRYFNSVVKHSGSQTPFVNTAAYSNNIVYGTFDFPVEMRSAPSFSLSSASHFTARHSGSNSVTLLSNHGSVTKRQFMPAFYISGTVNTASAGWVESTNSAAYFYLDAEL